MYPIESEDLPYEEDLLRNQYEPSAWIRYIEHKRSSIKGDSNVAVYFVYERALKCLPASYKLWKIYLDERTSTSATEYKYVNSLFERCLLYLGKMPRIWLDYICYLMRQRKVTMTRLVINRALQTLPIGQHYKVWEVALRFAKAVEEWAPLTTLCLWKRYWKIVSDKRKHWEEYYILLMRLKQYDTSAVLLLSLAEDPTIENEAEGNNIFWDKLCELLMAYGEQVISVDASRLLRVAISTSKSTGIYWTALAMLQIRQRKFDNARQVYEEAIESVTSVRDFSIVFDAYARFEETLLAADLDRRKNSSNDSGEEYMFAELDLRLFKLEALYKRRPFLVQEIRLKRHPNSVDEWSRYIALFTLDDETVKAYERALTSINPKKAKGDLAALWNRFAEFFESHDAIDSAKDIYRSAIESLDGVDEIWIYYGEFIRRHQSIDAALNELGPVSSKKGSRALWEYILDLEEARGLPDAIRAAYDHVLRTGLATIQIIVNYAAFLESINALDDAFRAYERGINMFGYPIAFDLWNIYLPKAINRWTAEGRLERLRDLFEQALKGCPEKHLKPIYLLLVDVEEKYGIGRASLKVLERACEAVPPADKPELYRMLLKKTVQASGLISARPVYEAALRSALSLSDTIALSLEYAALETKLGEIERARAIYGHTGSLGDPRLTPTLWNAWSDFEVEHGDESTYREMLRIKRAASAKYMTTPTAFVKEQESKDDDEDNEASGNAEEIPIDL